MTRSFEVEATKSFRSSLERLRQTKSDVADDVCGWISELARGGSGFHALTNKLGPNRERIFDHGRKGKDLRLVFSYYRHDEGETRLRLIALGGHDHVFRASQRIQNTTFELFPLEPPPEPRPVALEGFRQRISESVFEYIDERHEFAYLLDPGQERLVREPGLLLFDGAAGSGKTTVLAHRAYNQLKRNRSGRGLMVALEPQLAAYTKDILRMIARTDKEPLERIDVVDFNALLSRLVRKEEMVGTSLTLDPPPWKERSLPPVKSDPYLATVTPKDILAEYRGGLAGRWLADRPPPTRGDFQRGNSGERLQALLTAEQRGALFDRLQDWAFAAEHASLADRIASRRDWDRMGVARWTALQLIEGASIRCGGWTHLFVDEAQDFTAVELDLLARLVPDPASWTITGDERQVLLPSLFTWSRVKDMVFDAEARRDGPTKIPDPQAIHVNFRNPKPIMALARALFEAGRQALIEAGHQMLSSDMRVPEQLGILESKVMPCRVQVPRSQQARLARALAELGSKVAYFAVVTTEVEGVRKKVQAYSSNFAKCYSPTEVKGLEFDVVVAVDGLDAELDAKGGAPGVLLHALNKAYVLCTRSRQRLYLLEVGQPPAFLERPEVEPTLKRLSFENWLSEVGSEIEADDADLFANAAEDARKRGHLEVAYQNLIDGGDHGEAAKLAEQIVAKRAGEADRSIWWERAAYAWDQAGKPIDAARCRAELAEAAGRWHDAGQFWLRAGEQGRADLCQAHHLAGGGHHGEAAGIFKRLNRHDQAIEQYLKIPGGLDDALEVGGRAGKPNTWQVETCMRIGEYERAAILALQLAKHERPQAREKLNLLALRAWVGAGQPESAVRVGRETLRWQSRRIATELGDLKAYRAAADLLLVELPKGSRRAWAEKIDLYREAVSYLDKAGDGSRRAALCQEAAAWCSKQGALRPAADFYRLVPNEAAASHALVRAGKQAEDRGKWAEARQDYRAAGRPDLADALDQRAKGLKERARNAEAANNLDEALALFQAAGELGEVQRLRLSAATKAEREGHLEIALRHFKSAQDDRGVSRVQGRQLVAKAHETEQAGRLNKAVLQLREAGDKYSEAGELNLASEVRKEVALLEGRHIAEQRAKAESTFGPT